ncbi:MAG: esterase/lipase family protein [Cyanobacteriota bacterium]
MKPLPTVILPGYLAGAPEYEPLRQTLERRGFPTRVVPLRVRSWLPTVGGRPITPILKVLHTTLQQTLQEFGAEQVNLVAHSAGGWIARIYLGSVPYWGQVWQGHTQVATLISLGSPHTSRERWTKRNLDFVNNHYPGAFWPQVKYVCVAGKVIQGRRWGPGSLRENSLTWLAYNSYRLTAGEGELWGDGITPVEAAHLQGAINLTLPDCYHSGRGGRRWYGTPEVVEAWAQYLL